MGVKLQAASGGSVELVPTNTASTFTMTVPAVTATVLTDSAGVLNIGSGQIYKNASGNVGIGTSSPAQRLQVNGPTVTQTLYNTNAVANDDAAASIKTYSSATSLWNYLNLDASSYRFNTYGTERARIDSSGNLLVGTTTTNGSGAPLSLSRGGANWGVGPNSGGSFIIYNASGTGQYMTNGGTTWNSSSDERLKTQLTPFENAAEKVCSLRAGTGRYLTDDESVSRSFLIAQDVQAVLPEAVNVQDDEQGTLGLAYTDLIPLLTAAIQEQQALITTLTERITALETK